MERFDDIITGKELIVRKKVARFIEKIFQYQKYIFKHDDFKKIVYLEGKYTNEIEEKIKNFYDAFVYLLSNNKSPFSSSVVKKFFYILYCVEPSYDMVLRLTQSLFDFSDLPSFEKAVAFHLKAYEDMPEIDVKDRLIISLMFYNYCLVKGDLPMVVFVAKQLNDYEKIKESSDIKEMTSFLMNHMKDSKFQEKKYYENLRVLNYSDLYKIFTEDEKLLNKYGIKHLYVFGSFAKSNERIDSDIDLLANIDDNMSIIDKQKNIEILSDLYYKKLNRFVDIMEISNYLNDYVIKEMADSIKIF